MTPKIAQFVKALDTLTAQERSELFTFINNREKATSSERIILNEELRKAQTINFAPGPGACPTCGK
ncbi:MAG: hypothetical protein NVSMB6_03320 [Burkholderiaceae bacterium]|uniref:hypothetical protein n=1 Tax=Undibacterium sp. CY21W TaxID=2762293 RepID=UPI00164AD754|nr:hypothetical protein [Undibacterium sp. CY21W]MBC3926746.1 hypothetical protein [Undibacterium sp. CY21W]